MPTAKEPRGLASAFGRSRSDHFQCYQAKGTKGAVKFRSRASRSRISSGTMTVELKKPAHLCIPVDKNDETPGAGNHAGHLLCYRQRSRRASRKFAKLDTVYTANQFGAEILAVTKPCEVCAPRHPAGDRSDADADGDRHPAADGNPDADANRDAHRNGDPTATPDPDLPCGNEVIDGGEECDGNAIRVPRHLHRSAHLPGLWRRLDQPAERGMRRPRRRGLSRVLPGELRLPGRCAIRSIRASACTPSRTTTSRSSIRRPTHGRRVHMAVAAMPKNQQQRPDRSGRLPSERRLQSRKLDRDSASPTSIS